MFKKGKAIWPSDFKAPGINNVIMNLPHLRMKMLSCRTCGQYRSHLVRIVGNPAVNLALPFVDVSNSSSLQSMTTIFTLYWRIISQNVRILVSIGPCVAIYLLSSSHDAFMYSPLLSSTRLASNGTISTYRLDSL